MDVQKVLEEATRTAVGIEAASFALAAVGLNVQFGYTGLLNFGHVGFMLVGAYGAAITVDKGGPLWLGVLVGIGAAVVLAVSLGIPTLRLRADYLAIVTIAAAEILRVFVSTRSFASLTHGQQGIQGFASSFFDHNPIPAGRYGPTEGLKFNERELWLILVCWGMVALMSLLVWAVMRAPWGRVIRSIREDEDAARSLGKNVFSYKLQSLVLGGVIGAFAGIALAFDRSFVEPNAFLAAVTFTVYAVLILGGAGRIAGPIIGSIVYWFLFQFTDSFLHELGWADDKIGATRLVLTGVLLAGLMVFRPQGLFGDKKALQFDDG